MTLLEMSGVYQDSAAALHGRIVELRGQERAQEDPEAAFRLRRRIDELTAHYYDRSFHNYEKYTL